MTRIKVDTSRLIVCSECGRLIRWDVPRKDGLPAGAGFTTEQGHMINVCTDCLMQYGEEDLLK